MLSPRLSGLLALLLPAMLLLFAACNQATALSPEVKKHQLTEARQYATAPPPAKPKPISKKKKIYRTFDDGPNHGTRNVLDIVQQE
ncbi:MAG: hypothetical protein KA821_16600, partial [Chitinophagaceae bacterium]|nr:hypothetical protein [Chitinophagaceae bacterium]